MGYFFFKFIYLVHPISDVSSSLYIIVYRELPDYRRARELFLLEGVTLLRLKLDEERSAVQRPILLPKIELHT